MRRPVPEFWFEPALWIDGRYEPSKHQRPIHNPATGELLAHVAMADEAAVDRAVAGAVAVQKGWGKTSPFERGEVLKRVAELLKQKREDFAGLLTAEQGKPYLQALGEVDYAASFFQWFGEEARRVGGHFVPHPDSNREFIVDYKPIGVAAWITPWNFPLAQGAKKIAAALAAGCTGVWKPAESTPLIALAMASVFEQAGVPAGCVQILPGIGRELGPVLTRHPETRAISLTGSIRTGREVMREGAEGIKRVLLELGGNAPFIVLPEVDLDFVVDQLVRLKLFVSGQVCVTANRIFVPRKMEREFLEALRGRLAQSRVGDGLEEGVDAGPLIHREACEGVERLVQQAVRAGAKVEVRHDTFSNKPELASGSFYPPTILSGIEDSMVLCGCEIFGPVFPVLVYDGLEELIERANSVEQGLAGYVYGNDLTMCRRVARELEVGIVGVNEWRPLKAEIPFGGIKQSGLGVEGGREGIHDYLRTHVVSLPRD